MCDSQSTRCWLDDSDQSWGSEPFVRAVCRRRRSCARVLMGSPVATGWQAGGERASARDSGGLGLESCSAAFS